MKKSEKRHLTKNRPNRSLRQMLMETPVLPSRYDLDENSKQQLKLVRERYGSLSQFLKKTQQNKAISRFVAIYGRDSTDTDPGITVGVKPANRSR
jgi:lipopolysaccharide biosynthesis regulator YciM